MKKIILHLCFTLFLNLAFGQSDRIWATYCGGEADDLGYSVAIDTSGNVYLSGETQSTTGIASGGFQNIYSGGYKDAFLVKYDSSGNRLWSTYYGGTSYEWGYSIATDVSGNVYMAGMTTSSFGIAHNGFQNTISGGFDGFLVKFDANGNRLWATYYGGLNDDRVYTVATDASDNVYIAGITGTIYGIASGGFQNTYGGGSSDAFLVKFDTNGNRLWSTYYGGNGYDQGYSVITDASENVYLSGYTDGTNGIASGGFQNTLAGNNDAFLVKFDSDGNRLWATYYGGIDDDKGGFGLATDASENIYMTGYTNSVAGIAFEGFQNIHGGGDYDAFLVKFDENGSRIWATYYGGTANEEAYSIATDAAENVYLSGDSYSANGIAFLGYQDNLAGLENEFIVRFDSSGVRYCATYYGQAHDEEGRIILDRLGNSYMVGYTESDSAISSGGFQNTYGGGAHDAYLVKFSACNNPLNVTITASNPACYGQYNGSALANAQFGTAPYSYMWSDSVTTEINTGLCPGNYTVTVTDAADSSVSITLTVNDGLDIPLTVTQIGDTLYATIAPNYQWYFNDTIIPGADSQNYVITESGNYHVVTFSDSCTFSSNIIETGCVCVGINENEVSKKTRIYPNPANNTLTIETLIATGIYQLQDLTGKVLLSGSVTATKFTLDISALSKGIYLLSLIDGKRQVNRKVVKE